MKIAHDDVDALLEQAEIDAERIVAVTRMVVAAGLFVIFLIVIAPQSDVTDLAVMQRQLTYALGTILAYFTLGLVAWIATRRGVFRRWMIWPTAAADAAFTVVSIWAGMENTGLTGDMAFALPPVWLIPLVLAYGVIRVNPRIMAMIAVILLVGLGVLVSIDAGTKFGQDQHRVWLFLSLPPNLIRLGMIAMAAAVLVLAARRTHALLRQSIDVAVTNANLTRFLPRQLAPRLAEGGLDTLRRGRREEVGVLFIDIRGFTRLTETMPPADLAAFATEFRTRIVTAAEQTDGIVDKFMGDAAMILFPAGQDAADAARRCLRCTTHLQAAMADWSTTRKGSGLSAVSAGIGAHFGEVFSGVVGDASRLEFSVFGDPVNVASRLEDLTKDYETDILVSRAIVECADDLTYWTPVATLPLRGRGAMIDVMAPAASDT